MCSILACPIPGISHDAAVHSREYFREEGERERWDSNHGPRDYGADALPLRRVLLVLIIKCHSFGRNHRPRETQNVFTNHTCPDHEVDYVGSSSMWQYLSDHDATGLHKSIFERHLYYAAGWNKVDVKSYAPNAFRYEITSMTNVKGQ